jgi:hypothetical protein
MLVSGASLANKEPVSWQKPGLKRLCFPVNLSRTFWILRGQIVRALKDRSTYS